MNSTSRPKVLSPARAPELEGNAEASPAAASALAGAAQVDKPESVNAIEVPYDEAMTPAEGQIGAILVDSGKLTIAQAEKVLEVQKELGIRFGEAAVRLKLLKDEDVRFALARQHGFGYLQKGKGASVSAEVHAAYEPFSPRVEALRALRSQLRLRWFNTEPKHTALAITSPGTGDGRSYVAANLAVVFSQLGERTLLVDADLRHPRQHQLFGLENNSGLSAALSGRTTTVSIQRVPSLFELSVLTAGPTPPNPQELLGRELFPRLVEQLGRSFDVILFDVPDSTRYADAQIVAAAAGGALMVVREHRSRLTQVEQTATGLLEIGVTLVGAVLSHA